MENNINKLIEEVKEKGTVYNYPPESFKELYEIYLKMSSRWDSKEILVICDDMFISHIGRVIEKESSGKSYPMNINNNVMSFADYLSPKSLFVDGITYTFITKDIGVHAILAPAEITLKENMVIILNPWKYECLQTKYYDFLQELHAKN